MAFDKNVFVNCPFDDEYLPLLRPLLFTVSYLGFQPRIALESHDSARARIDKIVSIIGESKYAIHDLSRIKARTKGEYFRLNMPFELGIDYGCRQFDSGQARRKRILILGDQPYDYQKALSDISGSDIKLHGNKPEEIVRQVRHWLTSNSNTRSTGPTKIWTDFNLFTAATHKHLLGDGHSEDDVENIAIDELMGHMNDWFKRLSEEG
jgi:hypothetical protein